MKSALFLLIGSIALTSSYAGTYAGNHQSPSKSKPIAGISFGFDLTASPEFEDEATLWNEFDDSGDVILDSGIDSDYIDDNFIITDTSAEPGKTIAGSYGDALAPVRPVQPVHPPTFGNAPVVLPIPQRHGKPPQLTTEIREARLKGTPSVVRVFRPTLRVETPNHPDKQPWMSFTTDSERYRIVNEGDYGSKQRIVGPMGRTRRPSIDNRDQEKGQKLNTYKKVVHRKTQSPGGESTQRRIVKKSSGKGNNRKEIAVMPGNTNARLRTINNDIPDNELDSVLDSVKNGYSSDSVDSPNVAFSEYNQVFDDGDDSNY